MWIPINWSCRGTARCLGEYLDGTLPRRRRHTVEAHVRGCAACRRELESMRRSLALLSDLPRCEVSGNFEAALRARLAGIQASGEPTSRARFSLSVPLRPTARYLRAPWPSDARRLAPVGALAAVVAVALTAWNMQPVSPRLDELHPPSAYVSMVVREHQMLGTGADMNSTVVSHNLGGDPLGDGDEE